MAERGGLHRVLELPWLYTLFQTVISRKGAAERMQDELYPQLGSRRLRVLDIGCGPAAFYARYHEVAAMD